MIELREYLAKKYPDIEGVVLLRDGKFYIRNCVETCVVTGSIDDHGDTYEIEYPKELEKTLHKYLGKLVKIIGIKSPNTITINYITPA